MIIVFLPPDWGIRILALKMDRFRVLLLKRIRWVRLVFRIHRLTDPAIFVSTLQDTYKKIYMHIPS
jgi:hypothetical protein